MSVTAKIFTQTESLKESIKKDPVTTTLIVTLTIVTEFMSPFFPYFFGLTVFYIIWNRIMGLKEIPKYSESDSAQLKHDVIRAEENLRAQIIKKKLDIVERRSRFTDRLSLIRAKEDSLDENEVEKVYNEFEHLLHENDHLLTNDIKLPYEEFI